mgnify:CR=1 FL=1
MKTFFIIMAFLGGFLSAGQLLMKPSHNIDTNVDYYAKECFAIGPEHIKMTFPSI